MMVFWRLKWRFSKALWDYKFSAKGKIPLKRKEVKVWLYIRGNTKGGIHSEVNIKS